MAEVITLHRRASGGYKLSEDVMNDIRWRMHERTPKELAEAAGCAAATVYAIRSGRTKWPRGKTLFNLLAALDLELVLVDARTGQPLGRN